MGKWDKYVVAETPSSGGSKWDKYVVEETSPASKEHILPEFGKGLVRGVTDFAPIAAKGVSMTLNPTTPISSVMAGGRAYDKIANVPQIAKMLDIINTRPQTLKGQLAGGIGELGPQLAVMSPAIKAIEGINALRILKGAGALRSVARPAAGFGIYDAAKSALQETDPKNLASSVGRGAVQGLKSGAMFGAAGVPFAPLGRVGRAIGGGLGMAASAPEGERMSAGILGAGLGGMSGKEALTEGQRIKLRKQAINEVRGVIKPTGTEIENLNLSKGKSIDDILELVAKDKMTIEQVDRGGRMELDTTKAKETAWNKINDLSSNLKTQFEKSKYNPEFNLNELRSKVRNQIYSMKDTTAKTKNEMVKDVDEYIDAEISLRGNVVKGPDLIDVKNGMWKESFNGLRPTADKSARFLGGIIKSEVEKAYPDIKMKEINSKIADYSSLVTILHKAGINRVVSGGRLMKGLATTAGAGIGAAIGSPIPFIGPVAGAMGGGAAGQHIYDILSSPKRRSGKAASMYERSFEDASTPSSNRGTIDNRPIEPRQVPMNVAGLLENRPRVEVVSGGQAALPFEVIKMLPRKYQINPQAFDALPYAEKLKIIDQSRKQLPYKNNSVIEPGQIAEGKWFTMRGGKLEPGKTIPKRKAKELRGK